MKTAYHCFAARRELDTVHDMDLLCHFPRGLFRGRLDRGLFPPGQWYAALKKPWFTPPDWLFPVAWSTLYICMATAGARVAVSPDNAVAMAFWSLQIALNGLWTPVFFGLRRMKLGFVVLSGLWLSVALTMVALWQVDWIAGCCSCRISSGCRWRRA